MVCLATLLVHISESASILLGKDYASEFMNDYLLNFSFQSNHCCVTLIDEEYGNTYYGHNIAIIISYNSYAVRGPNIIQITPIWDFNNSEELAWDVYIDEEVYF